MARMRLVTFEADGKTRPGVLTESNGIFDLSAAGFDSMLDVIEAAASGPEEDPKPDRCFDSRYGLFARHGEAARAHPEAAKADLCWTELPGPRDRNRLGDSEGSDHFQQVRDRGDRTRGSTSCCRKFRRSPTMKPNSLS